ncbi:MAG: amidase [Bacteroidales bacterium]|nr:amidase [Bacteroidales bacterium]
MNVDKYFITIEQKEPFVKAFLHEENRNERVLKEIKEMEKRFPNPKNRPPLFCVPIGIKDIINIDGFETKCGSNLPVELFKGKEASFVTKLKEAGAVIMGKTVTTEFAYFEPGPTRNPHNYNHTPGGSSSGSAAAVAAGMVPLTFGTQTIGSIIRPAAFCGVVGFKPSFNRIAKDGVIPFSVSADHIGIFSQTIEMSELAASVLCKKWNKNIDFKKENLTIGVVTGSYIEQAGTEMIGFYNSKIEEYRQQGHKIVEIDLFGDIEKISQTHKKMNAAEFAEVHEEWFENYESLYRPKTKELILDGKKITIGELSEARLCRKKLRNKIEKIKAENNIDVWISPATLGEAPEGIATGSPLMNLPWTYSGLPVITIPGGKSKNNLPLALQYSGAFYEDEELLNICKLFYK